MISANQAVSRVDDSVSVLLPGASIYRYLCGLLLYRGFKSYGVTSRDIDVALDVDLGLLFAFVFASTIVHLVLPVVLKDEVGIVLHSPGITSVVVSSIASIATRLRL